MTLSGQGHTEESIHSEATDFYVRHEFLSSQYPGTSQRHKLVIHAYKRIPCVSPQAFARGFPGYPQIPRSNASFSNLPGSSHTNR